jgi:hypothetical protein
MFSRLQSRTLSIVKLHPDSTNDVSSPARKGKHHEKTPDHRLRHLRPVPVSVWLTCGNEYAFNQSSYSRHSTDRHCKHAECLPGPAQSASPPQSGVPCSKCSTCHGSGWEKYAASRRGATEAHQTAPVHRPGANAAESLLAQMWAGNSQDNRLPQRASRGQSESLP